MSSKDQPMQPVEKSEEGTLRFRKNAIVRFLLDTGKFDMNFLSHIPFTREDREQFAQLIGYSLSGFADLNYVSNRACEEANKLAEAISE